jgi:hypothetical protein
MEEFDLAMSRAGFIAPQVFPVFEAASASGTFGKIPLEQLLKNRTTNRAAGTKYNRDTFTFTTDSYVCTEGGHEEPVDDRESKLYREYFDAELVAAERARDAVLRTVERAVAAAVFNQTTYAAQSTSITNRWTDHNNATPLDDVETAVNAIWARTGVWPNAIIMSRATFRNLRLCSQIFEKVASQGAGASILPGEITIAQMQAAFDLPRIIVADTAQNTANEGQSAAISSIWSNTMAMVAKVATSNDIREPGLGRIFHWSEDGSTIGGTMESYRDETIRGDVIRCRVDLGIKTLYTEMGQLLTNVSV